MSEEGNRSYYSHDNSDGLSNNDEDNHGIKILMAYENKDVETEEVTSLKDHLETTTKVREQLQDVVISLRKEINDQSIKI